MHDLRWERWLDDMVQAYFVAVYRPELPGTERLRAARAVRQGIPGFGDGGAQSRAYLRTQLVSSDTQRRNTAARVLSEVGQRDDIDALVACYLGDGRQWLSPSHLVRGAARWPLDSALAIRIADVPLRLQSALVRAMLVHPGPEARVLLDRLVQGPEPVLGEAAVAAASHWGRPDVLMEILRRIDGTDVHPPALVPSGISAAAHLAVGGDRLALDWLEERTGDPDPHVAALAHARLAAIGWPGCVLELEELLETTQGAALAYALEAAESLALGGLVGPLRQVVLANLDRGGPGLDDNPADHAIRVMERITGRSLSVDLCGYDEHGALDAATRRRAALLFGAVEGQLEAGLRYRGGQPLSADDLVRDLLATSPQRVRVAALQLRTASGVDLGFDPREDLVANVAAIEGRQLAEPAFPAGTFAWQGQVSTELPYGGLPVANAWR